MIQIRQARQWEVERQKEIWRLCFGDEDSYINSFYAEQYKAEDTLLLLDDSEIAAMLTIIQVDLVDPRGENYRAAMLYAIATHPHYRSKGLASQLIDYTNKYLEANKTAISLLVPAEQTLFEFYYKLSYREGFYLKEVSIVRTFLAQLPASQFGRSKLFAISPAEYNRRRKEQLKGCYYLSYNDEEITYQQKLSRMSGADIYALDVAAERGCLVVERISAEKVLIKELLISEENLNTALKEIAANFAAQEYILRTPAQLGHKLGGRLRPFGLWQPVGGQTVPLNAEAQGYLGLAFD